jgi:hypothetical protein
MINGNPANATTCEGLPSPFTVTFDSSSGPNSEDIRSAPVPCTAGMVALNQVPPNVTNVEIWGGGGQNGYEYVAEALTNGVQTNVGVDITLTAQACIQDLDCSGELCSVFGACQPASELETVHVTWTVNGQPASMTSCGGLSNLTLQLGDVSIPQLDWYTAAAPCADGAFSVSNVPTDLDTVFIYDGVTHLIGSAAIANGSATLDLTP